VTLAVLAKGEIRHSDVHNRYQMYSDQNIVGSSAFVFVPGSYYYYFQLCSIWLGRAVAQLVKALRYKPEECWFDSRYGHWDSSLT